ncbi:MAG TPA: 16S rRNA (cytidine(1402)-2'-O)-methyltransferase [Anaerolineales bacterium]|nr:16S rRNA (cytidine(1402)-2'-O)-methyltransferase [Anaerolineales bacterium]
MGTLYLVATPIGNLEDITLRALRVLNQVRMIAAEDTRHTRKLLSHYHISVPLLSYHEHNKDPRLSAILSALSEGDVALVSDAGTPGLSDPGYELVRASLQAGHQVTPIPGPSAPVAALVASGLPTDAFVFVGYLPRKTSERRRLLLELARERRTLLAFEAPHRLRQTLADLRQIFGEARPTALCRELTKVHEEILRGTLGEVAEVFRTREPRGEITLVIGGPGEGQAWEEARVRDALGEQIALGSSPSEAARLVAAQAGWPRRTVYRMALESR